MESERRRELLMMLRVLVLGVWRFYFRRGEYWEGIGVGEIKILVLGILILRC